MTPSALATRPKRDAREFRLSFGKSFSALSELSSLSAQATVARKRPTSPSNIAL